MKEKEDKSVLLFFFPAVLKNIKHLKKINSPLSVLSSVFLFFLFIQRSSLKVCISLRSGSCLTSLSPADSQHFFLLTYVLNNDDYVEAGISSVFIQFSMNRGHLEDQGSSLLLLPQREVCSAVRHKMTTYMVMYGKERKGKEK